MYSGYGGSLPILGMAGEFAISGIFSHWQVRIALGAALHIGSASLNRYVGGGSLKGPKLLHFAEAVGKAGAAA